MSSSKSWEAERQGATLRAFRQKAGLKLGEAATAVGISYAYLSNIEAGRKPLTEVLIAKFADLYTCPQIALSRPELFPEVVAS